MRGAWIEMPGCKESALPRWSLPVRGAWIEISNRAHDARLRWSLPVRGAWIEISIEPYDKPSISVAPRAGSVD